MRYEDDERFKDYYLEDSYVLSIEETAAQVSFHLEAVLTPTHPQYISPSANEQHCYRLGVLRFQGVRELEWKGKRLRKSSDASGQSDYGNIDVFEILQGNVFRLSGDWGELEIAASEAAITLT